MREGVETVVRSIAIIGNPNSGKTTLFNSLTGLRQKVGNYPGVTVEKKVGRIILGDGVEINLLDLPGTYSLSAHSPDEQIATDILLGKTAHTFTPELVICVVDASNLERNLYLASQIIDCRIPVVIALNMMDVAHREGVKIDALRLSRELGVPVVPVVATKGIGVSDLRMAIASTVTLSPFARQWELPPVVQEECDELSGMLQRSQQCTEPIAFHEAIRLLSTQSLQATDSGRLLPEILEHLRRDHRRLAEAGIDRSSVFVESRYRWIKRVCDHSAVRERRRDRSPSDRIDAVLTHRIWGLVIFVALMGVMFQMIFTWASVPMEWIGEGFTALAAFTARVLPPGDLRDLIISGAIGGAGSVLTFLPQILFLFLFLGFLEDTGYMARAAFIMDRLMSKVGLHGKSFIPLLSSFACAIPGIMATRTIESRKDRIVTMLVAPLMSCSARLPVYALMIAAFIPRRTVLGFASLPGLTLVSLYLLGLVAALLFAWLFKKTLLKGETPTFIMELPPYKLPSIRSVLMQMWERSFLFVKRAGTIILGVSIVLWFLASYPKVKDSTQSQQLEASFAGRAGKLIEPLIRPLGFNWKIGIGLLSSVLQREVFVSTMGTIYNIKDGDAQGAMTLKDKMSSDIDPTTGRPTFTILTAICLMVYYVLAMQCLSTIAVVRRETNGWRWPLFQIGYMTAVAYAATFVVYHLGLIIAG